MASDPLKALADAVDELVLAAENDVGDFASESTMEEHENAGALFRDRLGKVAARLAAAEAVVEAARADTVCFDHADNCCADECSRCRDCARARIDLAAALAAYDKARGTR